MFMITTKQMFCYNLSPIIALGRYSLAGLLNNYLITSFFQQYKKYSNESQSYGSSMELHATLTYIIIMYQHCLVKYDISVK